MNRWGIWSFFHININILNIYFTVHCLHLVRDENRDYCFFGPHFKNVHPYALMVSVCLSLSSFTKLLSYTFLIAFAFNLILSGVCMQSGFYTNILNLLIKTGKHIFGYKRVMTNGVWNTFSVLWEATDTVQDTPASTWPVCQEICNPAPYFCNFVSDFGTEPSRWQQ